MEARTFAPQAALADVVECFWIGRWDLRGQEPHRMEILSDPCVNIAFEEGRTRVVGVSTRLFRRELAGEGFVRAVKLRAGAARAVIAEGPIARFSDRTVPLGEVFDDAARGSAASSAPPTTARRSSSCERLAGGADRRRALDLRRASPCATSPDPRVVTATQVAEATGMTIRPLQRLFRDYVGASPEVGHPRHRLQEAAVRLERDGGGSLAALAAELGYADHAHLSRDFKIATGRSPSEFARVVWE